MTDCWGWATWKRSWDFFEKDAGKLLATFSHKMIYHFNLDGGYGFFDQVVKNASGEMNTWAIFWYASVFLRNGLALYPTKSLVYNIGWDIGEHSDGIDTRSELFDKSFFDKRFYDVIEYPSSVSENKKFRLALRKYYQKNMGIKAKLRLKIEKFLI